MSRKAQASAFAPASIGNVAVGFDALGLAIENVGDKVTVLRTSDEGVVIDSISGDAIAQDSHQLSRETLANTAGISANSFWQAHGDGGGLVLTLHKGTPLGSGMGSSAASAVAAVVAANALLEAPLPLTALLDFAMQGEAFASKALHADNVAPSLFGGLTLSPTAQLPDVVRLPTFAQLSSVLVHPHLRVDTATSRKGLSEQVALKTAVDQAGYLARFVSACYCQDAEALKHCLIDTMIEPQRAATVQGFAQAKAAAMAAGAIGFSLSGSGPSVFAIVEQADAKAVASAISAIFDTLGIASDSWISRLDAPGAQVLAQ